MVDLDLLHSAGSNGPSLVLALMVGGALGLFFYGGLWWTVQRLTMARRPTPFSLGSMIVRMAAALAGFYWVMDGHWGRLAAYALGFFAVRTLLMYRYRPLRNAQPANHAK